MALSAYIRRGSVRGRCKCPEGSRRVFVGQAGVRCGKMVKRGGRSRFTFVKTPKTCNVLSAARKAARKKPCKYGVSKTSGLCLKSPRKAKAGRTMTQHELTMQAARRSPGRFAGYYG